MTRALNFTSEKTSIQTSLEVSEVIFDSSEESNMFNTGGATIIGILPDEDFSGTQVDPLWSLDGELFYPVKNTSGLDLTIKCFPETLTVFTPLDLLGFKYIKFVSNVSESCTFKILTRKV